jgi:hypothetical protein
LFERDMKRTNVPMAATPCAGAWIDGDERLRREERHVRGEKRVELAE